MHRAGTSATPAPARVAAAAAATATGRRAAGNVCSVSPRFCAKPVSLLALGAPLLRPPARTAPPLPRALPRPPPRAPQVCMRLSAARRAARAEQTLCVAAGGTATLGADAARAAEVCLLPAPPPPCAPPPHRNCSCTPRNCSDRVPVCSRVRCCVCVSPPKAKRTPLAACPQLRAALCSLPPGALASCGTAPDARRPTLVSDARAASRFAVAERSRPDFKRACALSCC
jgi:hypothetical protein